MTDQRLTVEPTGRVVGLDGCAGGWFAVWSDSGTPGLQHRQYGDLAAVFTDHGDADRLLVDIPIGLDSSTARECDDHARTRLGARGVSVFPTPCRSVVEYHQQDPEAATYDRANEIQRGRLGSGLSRQAWNITPKIAAMDRFLRTESPSVDVIESHPECCFAALNDGYPIAQSKSNALGRAARFGVIDDWAEGWESCYEAALDEYFRNAVARDDIVDAIVLAIAGRQPLRSIPDTPPVDDCGLPMRIVVPDVDASWRQYTELAEQ